MKRSVLMFLLVCTALSAGAAGRETVKTVLFPFREAVIAARADSTLQPYRFKLGEPFEAGAVLVTLDDSRYALEEQRAAGQFEFARATYEDKKQLREKNFTSDYELKKADFDRRIAENDLASARLPDNSAGLRYGMRGIARLSGENVSLGYRLFKSVVLYFRGL